jgi:hypothetical protein
VLRMQACVCSFDCSQWPCVVELMACENCALVLCSSRPVYPFVHGNSQC